MTKIAMDGGVSTNPPRRKAMVVLAAVSEFQRQAPYEYGAAAPDRAQTQSSGFRERRAEVVRRRTWIAGIVADRLARMSPPAMCRLQRRAGARCDALSLSNSDASGSARSQGKWRWFCNCRNALAVPTSPSSSACSRSMPIRHQRSPRCRAAAKAIRRTLPMFVDARRSGLVLRILCRRSRAGRASAARWTSHAATSVRDTHGVRRRAWRRYICAIRSS